MEDIKRVALYCRYSTHTQSDNFSIDIQKERMEAMCKSKGWEVSETFIDAAYSGSNMERPFLQNLLSRLGEFDVIMVYRLDRLSRSQRDTMTLIQDHFLKNDVAFVSVSETLDTTTPFGMAMIGILAVFAELERATITERMQGGIKKKVEAGYRINGGNHAPTGYAYEKTENGLVLVPHPENALMVKKVFDYFELHENIIRVQEKLKIEGYKSRKYSTLRQILSNRLYLGEVVYLGESYQGVHEALIDEEQFNRVQKIFEGKPKAPNRGKSKQSLFAGLITCGCCGEKYMSYSYKTVKNVNGAPYVRSYLCRARRFPAQYDVKCFNAIYKESVIVDKFEIMLNALINLKLNELEKGDPQKINYSLAIKKIDDKIARLIDLYEDGEIGKETLNGRIAKRKEEKVEILGLRRKDLNVNDVRLDLESLQGQVINFIDLPFENQMSIINKTIRDITVVNDEIIFNWNF